MSIRRIFMMISKNNVYNSKIYLNKQDKLAYILDHNSTTIVMTIITIYALFGDDIRILTTNKDGDEFFWVFNIISMVAFTLEIIVASIAKVKFFLYFRVKS